MAQLVHYLILSMNNYFRILFYRCIIASKILMGKEVTFLELLISRKVHPNFFYIQIGANDGKKWDPIFRIVNILKLKGIALEPIKDIFEKLTINYKRNPQVKLVNKAIHKTEKEAVIYRIDPTLTNIPNWTEGTGSFFKKHHELSGFNSSQIIEEKVSCISFNDLINQEDISKIDLVQIDTEGYDFEIVYSIDFNNFKPSIISFEHAVKSNVNTLASFNKIINHLSLYGYKFWHDDFDIVAYQ